MEDEQEEEEEEKEVEEVVDSELWGLNEAGRVTLTGIFTSHFSSSSSSSGLGAGVVIHSPFHSFIMTPRNGIGIHETISIQFKNYRFSAALAIPGREQQENDQTDRHSE